MNTESWHTSFFKGENVKSVFEFELPGDAEEHYNALNGFKYRQLLDELTYHLDASIKQAKLENSEEADYLTPVLNFIGEKAVELDVKVFRK